MKGIVFDILQGNSSREQIIAAHQNQNNQIVPDQGFTAPPMMQSQMIPQNTNLIEIPVAKAVVESLSLEEKELEMIKKALEKYNGKRKKAANELGISERTLYRKIKQYDLE